MVLWLLDLIIIGTAAAAPSIVFPVNSQVPPVARASNAFQFEFAASTFSDNALGTSYSLSGSPAWLQLDGSTRSLYGTPGPQDAGPVYFNLVATDDSGSTSMPVTLIVSTDPGPSLGTPIADQLSTYGALAGPEELALSYSSPLALSFSSDIFTNTDSNTVYYALCANNTPLPSWIHFDANTLSFSGTTPQSASPAELSQTYDIHLTASDVVGFAGAVASFQLIIESHIFAFGPATQTIEITPGVEINFSGLQTSLKLDGSPANAKDLGAVVANSPSWMSLDTSSLVLSGTPPDDVSLQNFTVSATNIHGDQAKTTICLVIANGTNSSLFLKPVEPRNVTIGSDFEYSLADTVNPDPDLQISVALEEAPWLIYNPSNRTLYGEVPNNLGPGQVLINITVTQGNRSQSEALAVDLDKEAAAPSSQEGSSYILTTSTGSATASSATRTGDKKDGDHLVDGRGRSWIAAAVLLPLIAVSGMIFFLCLYRRKRKIQRSDISPSKLWKDEISRPQPILAEKMKIKYPAVNTGDLEYESRRHRRQSSKAPMLADLRRHSYRWSGFGSARHSPAVITELEQGSRWQLAPEDQERFSQTDKASSRKRRSSYIPGNADTLQYSISKRYSRARKFGSVSSGQTPFSRSLSGFGHGRNRLSSSSIRRGRSIGIGHGNGGPYDCLDVRPSWRNFLSMKSQSSDWTSTEGGSAVSELNFPRPPTSDALAAICRQCTIHEASDETAPPRALPPTIRRVVSSSDDPWPERKAYLEQRAKSRQGDNALFSAKDTRISSQILSGRLLRSNSPPTLPKILPSTPHHSTPPTHPPSPKKPSSTYSRSSSLSPHPKPPSPSKPSPSPRKSHLFPYFPVRALSPLLHPSTTSLNSRFRDSSPFFDDADPDLELRLEVDEHGHKRWTHVDPRLSDHHSSLLAQGLGFPSPVAAAAAGESDFGDLLHAAEARRGSGKGDEGERGEGVGRAQRRRFLGSQRAKRPVSVGGLPPAGVSLRGDLAFL
ncbi:MAG: hypothetical protein Q9195_000532 [Heterodermia aff. obscurata]